MKIFISYQNNSLDFVENLVGVLEMNNHNCFYAKRDIVTGVYAQAITQAIDWCEIFIVILTDDAYLSPGVCSEIELVNDKLTRHNPVLIIPVKMTESELPDSFKYYLKPHNWVIGFSKSENDVIKEIDEKITKGVNGINNNFVPNIDSRLEIPETNKNINSYLSFMSDNPDEDFRLERENDALYLTEKAAYDKIFLGKSDLNVLDCHALHPRSALKRLNREETNKYIGLCYDKVTVDNANKSLGNPYVKFYNMSLLDNDYEAKINEIMAENDIEKFDVVNITMGIMDTKKSFKLLKRATSLLKEGGYIYIRDIDDIVTYGYPDNDGLIKKFIDMLKEDTFAGNRESARTIYQDLVRCRAKYISLEQSGVNTSTMSYDNKKNLFISYFTYAKREFQILAKKEIDNKKYNEYIEFIDDYIDDFEEAFESDEFIFNSGFFIYIAKF